MILKYTLILLICSLAFATFEEDNNVLVLTKDNFMEAINTFEYLLVEFFAPWCGHCKRLEPQYAEAAQTLIDQGSKVRLAKVDATVETEVAEKLGVDAFPTLFMFINGQPSPYTGGRTALTIVQWLKKETETPSTYTDSIKEIEQAIKKDDLVVLYYGDELDAGFRLYKTVAAKYMDIPFFHTISQELWQTYNPSGSTKISIIRNFDERQVDFNDDYTVKAIEEFLLRNRYPTILNYNQKYAKLIFGDMNPSVFLIYGRGDSSERAREALYSVVGKIRSKILITTCPFDDEGCQKVMKYMGLRKEDLPSLSIIKPPEGNKGAERYIFEGKITGENIVQFFEDYQNKRIEQIIRSEEVPEKNVDPVKVIVGKTFRDIVYDDSKDVLVFFNDVTSDESKEYLKGSFDGLARLVEPIQDLTVAKIDANNNEVRGLTLKNKALPQILLFPKNDKTNPITYEGEKGIKALYEFLKQSLTVEYDESLIKVEEMITKIRIENEEREKAAEYSRRKMEQLAESQAQAQAQKQASEATQEPQETNDEKKKDTYNGEL